MKVSIEKCSTVEEELEYIEKQFNEIGDFFTCDVHPSVVKASNISFHRLWRKWYALTTSLEYKYYQWSNYPEILLDSELKEYLEKDLFY